MNGIKKAGPFFIILPLLLALLSPRPEPKKSAPFALNTIVHDLSPHPKWEIKDVDAKQEEIEAVLGQPYRYLGSGGQCYTFLSEDGQYVIKFFKQKAFAIPSWIAKFPLPFVLDWLKEKKTRKKAQKQDTVFSAFKLAFEALKEETGLLYVHLNPTTTLNKTLTLCDAQGNLHTLNLDPISFVVQKKALLVSTTIDTLMQKGEIDQAKHAIDQMLTLAMHFYEKGYRNRDPNLRSNFGFIEGEPILIDMGRMVVCEEMKEHAAAKKELLRVAPRFRRYLTAKHPTLLPHFEERIANFTEDRYTPDP